MGEEVKDAGPRRLYAIDSRFAALSQAFSSGSSFPEVPASRQTPTGPQETSLPDCTESILRDPVPIGNYDRVRRLEAYPSAPSASSVSPSGVFALDTAFPRRSEVQRATRVFRIRILPSHPVAPSFAWSVLCFQSDVSSG